MTTESCTHHWVLASSSQSTQGVCRICGDERSFSGGIAETTRWSRTSMKTVTATKPPAEAKPQKPAV